MRNLKASVIFYCNSIYLRHMVARVSKLYPDNIWSWWTNCLCFKKQQRNKKSRLKHDKKEMLMRNWKMLQILNFYTKILLCICLLYTWDKIWIHYFQYIRNVKLRKTFGWFGSTKYSYWLDNNIALYIGFRVNNSTLNLQQCSSV